VTLLGGCLIDTGAVCITRTFGSYETLIREPSSVLVRWAGRSNLLTKTCGLVANTGSTDNP